MTPCFAVYIYFKERQSLITYKTFDKEINDDMYFKAMNTIKNYLVNYPNNTAYVEQRIIDETMIFTGMITSVDFDITYF